MAEGGEHRAEGMGQRAEGMGQRERRLEGEKVSRTERGMNRMGGRLEEGAEGREHRAESIGQRAESMGQRAEGIRKFQGYFQRLLAINPDRWKEAAEYIRIYFPDDPVMLGIVPEGDDALESRILGYLAKTAPDWPEEVSVKPEPPENSKKPATDRYHTVGSGETLYRISRRYGVAVKEILRLNRLKEGAVIRTGQKLKVCSQ